MRAVLKIGALKLSFGGKQYIISQRIRSLVEIKRQFRREFALEELIRCEIGLVEISLKMWECDGCKYYGVAMDCCHDQSRV